MSNIISERTRQIRKIDVKYYDKETKDIFDCELIVTEVVILRKKNISNEDDSVFISLKDVETIKDDGWFRNLIRKLKGE